MKKGALSTLERAGKGGFLIVLFITIVGCPTPDGPDRSFDLSAPKNLSASQGTYIDKILLTWSPVDSAVEYRVHESMSSDGSYTSLGEIESEAAEITGVTPGTHYFYKVSALDASGREGPLSGCAEGWASLPPGPIDVTATDDFGGAVYVSWSAVSAADRYYVARSASPDGVYGDLTPFVTTTTFTDTTAVAATQYYYKVRAYFDSTGSYSDYSAYDGGMRLFDGPAVNAPVNAAYTSSYVFTWTYSWGSTSGTGDRYEIEWSYSLAGGYVSFATYVRGSTEFEDRSATAYPDAGDRYKTVYMRIRAVRPTVWTTGWSTPAGTYIY